MTEDMTVVISWLALFALLYQVYLQRTHNEKSLKPLGQIDLRDRKDQIYVRISNNGLGPMIIDRLTFRKAGKIYTAIEDCLELDRRSYASISVSESVQKIILPNAYLTLFENRLGQLIEEAEADGIRQQLSPITVQVEFHDIYNNRITIERNLQWFSRHAIKEEQVE